MDVSRSVSDDEAERKVGSALTGDADMTCVVRAYVSRSEDLVSVLRMRGRVSGSERGRLTRSGGTTNRSGTHPHLHMSIPLHSTAQYLPMETSCSVPT